MLTGTLSAKFVSADWSAITGDVTLTFKRQKPVCAARELTDTITVLCLIAPDNPAVPRS